MTRPARAGRPPVVMDAIWRYLGRRRSPARLVEIARAVGRPRTSLSGALDLMIRRGQVLRVGYGRYVRSAR